MSSFEKPSPQGENNESNTQILYIDDCRGITSTMSRLFKRKALQIIVSNCPQEAEKIILGYNKPIIIISDIRMPIYTGIELAERTYTHRARHNQPFANQFGKHR